MKDVDATFVLLDVLAIIGCLFLAWVVVGWCNIRR